MKEKVIMLIEANIQLQRRGEELVEAARDYLPLIRAEPGLEALQPDIKFLRPRMRSQFRVVFAHHNG